MGIFGKASAVPTATVVGADPITFAQFGDNVSITLVGEMKGSGINPAPTTLPMVVVDLTTKVCVLTDC